MAAERTNYVLRSGMGTVAAEDYDPRRHGPIVEESDESSARADDAAASNGIKARNKVNKTGRGRRPARAEGVSSRGSSMRLPHRPLTRRQCTPMVSGYVS
jgi:hypothetical protein